MPVSYSHHRSKIGCFLNLPPANHKSSKFPYRCSKTCHGKFLFLFLLLMSSTKIPVEFGHNNDNFEIYLQKHLNETMHAKHGNIHKFSKLKLLHVNKGNVHFKNKLTEMRIIIDKFTPDIFSISEANVTKNYTNYTHEFNEYNFELNLMYNNIGISRNILLIRKGIHFKRRYDLEHPSLCNIWIELSPGTKRPFLIMGGYRQWSLPKTMDPFNTKDKNSKQLERYAMTLDFWKTALQENKDIIVLTDVNIDSSIIAEHNKLYKIKNIEKIHKDFLECNNITTHNSRYTRFQSHQKPSILDHVFSNCPAKITPVNTIGNIFSDHSILQCTYLARGNIYHPKFTNIRNFKLVTRNAILAYMENSHILKDIFSMTDPNEIASAIQIELNSILESIAPAKRIQFRKDNAPYINEELRSKLKTSNDLLTDAIKHNDNDHWRLFRHYRNQTMKEVNIAKKESIINKFKNNNDKWKLIKDINKSNKYNPPTTIKTKEGYVTSPRQIAQLANSYFINKIKLIRESFSNVGIDPIEILRILIPKVQSSFKLEPIHNSETVKILKKLKNSNSTGYDGISNKFLKKVKLEIAPIITHLINAIIRTSTVPKCFKISRITPILKADKITEEIESYRPINNLPTLEKVFEEYLLTKLTNYLEDNKIINDNMHGGRQGHSTSSALLQINETLNKNHDKNMIYIALITDNMIQ